MKLVIETAQQATEFLPRFFNSFAIVLPIGTDPRKHPRNNKLCCLYIRVLSDPNVSAVVPYYHDESVGIYPWFHDEFGRHNKVIFTLNKKHYQHYLGVHENLYDLSLLHHMYADGVLDMTKYETKSHQLVKRNNPNRADINSAIPLAKHLEWGDAVTDHLIPMMKDFKVKMALPEYTKYNDALDELYQVETHGMKVVPEHLLTTHPNVKTSISKDDMVYSDYNILTSTGRPSNAFGGINFSALNKEDGSRKAFVSRYDNGQLVYVDFESYHLRLIAQFVGFEFPNDAIGIHEYFARQYFDIDGEVTEEQYEESKRISFHALYGAMTKETRDVAFFMKVAEFIDALWDRACLYGYLKTPIFKRRIPIDTIRNNNKQKLFNYFLQAYETESNIQLIRIINSLLTNSKVKLVMYLYDGFVFDSPLSNESTNLLNTVCATLERDGKFPVRMYTGETFDDMDLVLTRRYHDHTGKPT